MNLQSWISQAREHWEEHLPAKFESLKEAGTLGQALRDAAEQTHREMSVLEERGFRDHEAWEMVREKYLFLRAEPEPEEPLTPLQKLMQEVAAMQHHAAMALADPDYEIPDPPTD